MQRLKASIIITALVTVIILFILAMILLNILYFSMNNSERDAEINRGRWFLEGRIQEYFDALMTGGGLNLTGKIIQKENIAGFEQNYLFETIRKNENSYILHASMNWNNRYPIEQQIEFGRLNLFDYAVFFNGGNMADSIRNIVIAGDIGSSGNLTISQESGTSFYCYFSGLKMPRADYFSSEPRLEPLFFTNNPLELTDNYDSITQWTIFKGKRLLYRKIEEKFDLPIFQKVWDTYAPFRDENWIITKDFPIKETNIINMLTGEKELVAVGDGHSTVFRVKAGTINNVYIKKTDSYSRYQYLDSRKYSYFTGENERESYFTYNNEKLELKASSEAVPLFLPEDSFRSPGYFTLCGSNFSFISSDENIGNFYFGRISLTGMLVEGIDYSYSKADKSVTMLSDKFYRSRIFLVGTGDGKTTIFPVTLIPGNYLYYSGNNRITSYNQNDNNLTISPPPKRDQKITAFSPPAIFFKKEPPSKGVGIFIDKTDHCALLDLNSIINPPKNGVIFSFLPLLVKGKSSFPLMILSKENIYLENINPDNTGETLMFAAQKGIWIYSTLKKTGNIINKCFIYSPNSALFSVNENGENDNSYVSIYGTVILTSENTNSVSGNPKSGISYIYFPGLTGEMDRIPFKLFPMPLNIDLVKRN